MYSKCMMILAIIAMFVLVAPAAQAAELEPQLVSMERVRATSSSTLCVRLRTRPHAAYFGVQVRPVVKARRWVELIDAYWRTPYGITKVLDPTYVVGKTATRARRAVVCVIYAAKVVAESVPPKFVYLVVWGSVNGNQESRSFRVRLRG